MKIELGSLRLSVDRAKEASLDTSTLDPKALLVRPKDVAKMLGCRTRRDVQAMEPQLRRLGVRVRKIGRRKFYNAADLREFAETGKVTRKT